MNVRLSPEQLRELFIEMDRSRPVEVVRIRYKNRQEIRRTELLGVAQLQELVLTSHEDGKQPGGDLELMLDSNRLLVGHHDGIYWIEEPKPNEAKA